MNVALRNQSQRTKSGFTLIELLVVIVILGFLIVAGLGSFISSQKKSRDSKRKNDLRQVAISLETYYNDIGHYPYSDANGDLWGCGAGAASVCTWGQPWTNTTTAPQTIYMPQLPTDPSQGGRYYYVADAAGTYFQIYAHLENTLDTGFGVKQIGYSGTNCASVGTTTCTYGVASTNAAP